MQLSIDYKRQARRICAGLVCIGILLVTLACAASVTNHICPGRKCLTCKLLAELRSYKLPSRTGVVFLGLTLGIVGCLCGQDRRVVRQTLESLKTRLDE